MANINNHNFNKYDLRLSNSDYWDLFLTFDEFPVTPCTGVYSGSSLAVHYDFNNSSIFSGTTIYSLTTWDGAVNSGVTMNDIGLTGIDNGLFTYNKVSGDTSNISLVNILTGSTITLTPGDNRLILNPVTGSTGLFVYDTKLVTPNSGLTSVGTYLELCGGFYQGYYKLDGYDYEVLPTRVPKAWVAEFWLRKSDSCSGTTGTTLNDENPNNEGFFFYMGTRAENKFWNCFDGLNTGGTCTTGSTSGCTDFKETNVTTSSGVPLCPSGMTTEYNTDNNFLLFSRGVGGLMAYQYTGQTTNIINPVTEITDDRNPFLIYSRADGGNNCDGSTGATGSLSSTYSGSTSLLSQTNPLADIIDNAIGFRITSDGSIGYRLLTVTATCVNEVTVSGTSIEENYSISGTVENDIWSHVAIRFVADYKIEGCDLETNPSRLGTLYFYINGKLKHYVEGFSEFIAKRLFDNKEKQQGVPFNISLGGGSQGLVESITFDGPDPYDVNMPIATNFAGTFIGDISQFKFYIDDIDVTKLTCNFLSEASRYSVLPNDTFLLTDEISLINLILQENGQELDWLP
jgi:hypothetical protein